MKEKKSRGESYVCKHIQRIQKWRKMRREKIPTVEKRVKKTRSKKPSIFV